jgi:hypothetical protein
MGHYFSLCLQNRPILPRTHLVCCLSPTSPLNAPVSFVPVGHETVTEIQLHCYITFHASVILIPSFWEFKGQYQLFFQSCCAGEALKIRFKTLLSTYLGVMLSLESWLLAKVLMGSKEQLWTLFRVLAQLKQPRTLFWLILQSTFLKTFLYSFWHL